MIRIYQLTELPLKLRKRIEPQPAPLERYQALYDSGRDPQQPCWLWQGGKNNAGYGVVKFNGKVWGCHRLMYHRLVERLVQPGKARDRDGEILDHICEQRACCNPHHLEKISQSENTKRGARHRQEGETND